MTTANPLNHQGLPILDEKLVPASVFAIGAGNVNPSRANDPGLVYDIKPEDYVSYLCGLNYGDGNVGLFLQRKVKCSEEKSIGEQELNYPSFSLLMLSNDTSDFTTFKRVVTNVGQARS